MQTTILAPDGTASWEQTLARLREVEATARLALAPLLLHPRAQDESKDEWDLDFGTTLTYH